MSRVCHSDHHPSPSLVLRLSPLNSLCERNSVLRTSTSLSLSFRVSYVPALTGFCKVLCFSGSWYPVTFTLSRLRLGSLIISGTARKRSERTWNGYEIGDACLITSHAFPTPFTITTATLLRSSLYARLTTLVNERKKRKDTQHPTSHSYRR